MRNLILAAVVAFALPAAAQTPPEPTPATRAMAAGYKALMVCGAVKNAEDAGGSRTIESVEANELVGIYPELDELVREMPVELTENAVSVAWDEAMPPRVATHVGLFGCRIMPVGWTGPGWQIDHEGRRGPERPLAVGEPVGDRTLVRAAIEGAFGNRFGDGTNTTGLAILQNGRIVAERYGPDFGPDVPQRTWSVAKSLAGTIIGAAVQRGEVDVNAPAALADWSRDGDPRAAITLDNLMRMASGLTSDTAGNRTDGLYFGGVGVDEQAPTWPLIAPPGSRYRYANNDTLLAVLSIAPTFREHPPEELFRTLGMVDTVAETDWRGNYVLSSQVWSTARDLARFGQLYVDDGVVNGVASCPRAGASTSRGRPGLSPGANRGMARPSGCSTSRRASRPMRSRPTGTAASM